MLHGGSSGWEGGSMVMIGVVLQNRFNEDILAEEKRYGSEFMDLLRG